MRIHPKETIREVSKIFAYSRVFNGKNPKKIPKCPRIEDWLVNDDISIIMKTIQSLRKI